MTKFLLDLFCGVGGAAVGYHRAGFTVVGVDHEPQPDYPFEFIQADALGYLNDPGAVARFDVIHASPPCQGYTTLNYAGKEDHPKLVPDVRWLLALTGKITVMENVVGSPVRSDLFLCGTTFGLDVRRHRLFECHGFKPQPKFCGSHDRRFVGVYGNGGGKGTVEQWRQAMGIDWTTSRRSLAQAIPPAYTEYIGQQIMEASKPRKYIIPTLSRPPRRNDA